MIFIITSLYIYMLAVLGCFIFAVSSIQLVGRFSVGCLPSRCNFFSRYILVFGYYWIAWVLVFGSLYWCFLKLLSLSSIFPLTLFWKGCRALRPLLVSGVASFLVEHPGHTGFWCWLPFNFGLGCSLLALSLGPLLGKINPLVPLVVIG